MTIEPKKRYCVNFTHIVEDDIIVEAFSQEEAEEMIYAREGDLAEDIQVMGVVEIK